MHLPTVLADVLLEADVFNNEPFGPDSSVRKPGARRWAISVANGAAAASKIDFSRRYERAP
ncbi:hypothetical protein [Burkholderia ubonensis]|uniref:hypothetical protein n=1 Tax=Burkholderia ubonensis TaxID=101571 RepID=UPI000A510752|nr:hypothetical protein [Burkholderia ubonensis]